MNGYWYRQSLKYSQIQLWMKLQPCQSRHGLLVELYYDLNTNLTNDSLLSKLYMNIFYYIFYYCSWLLDFWYVFTVGWFINIGPWGRKLSQIEIYSPRYQLLNRQRDILHSLPSYSLVWGQTFNYISTLLSLS